MKKKIISLVLVLTYLLTSLASAIEPMDVNSKASILIDASDGHELYGENADTKQFPASITKLMTALLVVENVDNFDELVIAKESAYEDLSDGGSSVGIKEEEEMSVDNLLICLLVASANEAANILAEHVSGSVDKFVELMNTRATELGLTGTHFVNAHGLHNDDHYTTARDIAKLAMEVQKYERLREICSMDKATIPATNIGKERFFYTTNSLISEWKELGYKYSRANGMKTGSTTPAGLCLVASAEYEGTELISVVLGAEKDENGKKGNFVESKRLLIWGFENFRDATLVNSSDTVCEVKIRSGKNQDYVTGHASENFSLMMPIDFDKSKVEYRFTALKEEFEAPVKKGDEIGTVTVVYEGKEYAALPVVASYDVERSEVEYTKNKVKDFFGSTLSVVCVALALLVFFVVLFIIIKKKKDKRQRKQRRRYR